METNVLLSIRFAKFNKFRFRNSGSKKLLNLILDGGGDGGFYPRIFVIGPLNSQS